MKYITKFLNEEGFFCVPYDETLFYSEDNTYIIKVLKQNDKYNIRAAFTESYYRYDEEFLPKLQTVYNKSEDDVFLYITQKDYILEALQFAVKDVCENGNEDDKSQIKYLLKMITNII